MALMQMEPVHWTTYVQTFAIIASTVGTFVYVYFTYHIMKWAVGQGQATVDMARRSISEVDRRQAAIDSELESFLRTNLWSAIEVLNALTTATATNLPAILSDAEQQLDRLLAGWMDLAKREIVPSARRAMEPPMAQMGHVLAMVRRAQTGNTANGREIDRYWAMALLPDALKAWSMVMEREYGLEYDLNYRRRVPLRPGTAPFHILIRITVSPIHLS